MKEPRTNQLRLSCHFSWVDKQQVLQSAGQINLPDSARRAAVGLHIKSVLSLEGLEYQSLSGFIGKILICC